MAQVKILLIDDDVTLLELLADQLRAAGYQLVTAPDGPTGLRLAADAAPDLVVLDVMMPGMSGWEVCERLRARRDVPAERLHPAGRDASPERLHPAGRDASPERLHPAGRDAPAGRLYNIPIIMLTAKGEEMDKLRGFHLGVDDYVTKPFSFAELTARVGAVLVRASRGQTPAHSLTSGDLTIDFDNRHVTLAGQPVELTPIEYRLLENLARRSGHTVPTETLIAEVWGPEYAGEAEHVKHYVWTLRKKIETDPGDPQHLITERGFGYRFE